MMRESIRPAFEAFAAEYREVWAREGATGGAEIWWDMFYAGWLVGRESGGVVSDRRRTLVWDFYDSDALVD